MTASKRPASPLPQPPPKKANTTSNGLSVKPRGNRPLAINPQNQEIMFETFHPLAEPVKDFLVTIAEPVSRPRHIHIYKLTASSLYTAISLGLQPDDIIRHLDKFLASPIPQGTINFIRMHTSTYGKLKLVLRGTQYFLQSSDLVVLKLVLQKPEAREIIRDAVDSIATAKKQNEASIVIPGTENAASMKQAGLADQEAQTAANGVGTVVQQAPPPRDLTDDGDDEEDEEIFTTQIPDQCVEAILQLCRKSGFPVLEEYDFRQDILNANLEIDLRPFVTLREHQSKCLGKMFGGGRAKSGIIVLPCGAGKTLVGITAACTIKKGCIILCNSTMSALQWRSEIIKFSNIRPEDVALFTSDHKEPFRGNTGIVVTTYSMVTMSRARAAESQRMMDFITKREWGLMLLDEVHIAPANMFRTVISKVKTHCKLGLTATLLREDDKIDDLDFLIGPKLYEADWMELAEKGYIAKVQCYEVRCTMSGEFFDEYLRNKDNHRKQELLCAMNPNKYQACQYLIQCHEERGDKIIVFSDSIMSLEKYARGMGKAYIYGGTPESERMNVLENFQLNPKVNTLFLSKIGDTSLDLPEATVLIQISSQYGSRRQEAQRLGRILRAKRRNDEGFNAYFYSLVSTPTKEMHYSSKRQEFLVNQGYAYKVIPKLRGLEDMAGRMFTTPQERRELLQTVLLESEKSIKDDETDELFQAETGWRRNVKVRRTAGGLQELSGGQTMSYSEGSRAGGRKKAKPAPKSAFFKKLDREKERRKLA